MSKEQTITQINKEKVAKALEEMKSADELIRQQNETWGIDNPTDSAMLEIAEGRLRHEEQSAPPEVPLQPQQQVQSLALEEGMQGRTSEEAKQLTDLAMQMLDENYPTAYIRDVVGIQARIQDTKRDISAVSGMRETLSPLPIPSQAENDLVKRYDWLSRQQVSDPEVREEMKEITRKLKELGE